MQHIKDLFFGLWYQFGFLWIWCDASSSARVQASWPPVRIAGSSGFARRRRREAGCLRWEFVRKLPEPVHSNSYFAVSVIPVSPRLPIQHSDRPMCKARRGLLSSGPTSRGRLQVNIFFSTHQTWFFLQHVCKYFAAGAWPPSSWVSTSLTPSLLAGLKNNAGLKNLLHSVCSATSSIHVLPQSILSHYSATFVVLSDLALLCHIC